MWFRRDLRLIDNPALLAAIESAQKSDDGRVIPLFVIDSALWEPAGHPRRAYLAASLRSLDKSLGGALLVRHGRPQEVLPALCAEVSAAEVHIAADFGGYGRRRDAAVEAALGDVPLIRTGSPYAVAPLRVTKDDGTPYRVYTPFWRAWERHGWRAPAPAPGPDAKFWKPGEGDGIPDVADPGIALPPAGEQAAWERWETFRSGRLAEYKEMRNRPDVDGTSAIGHHLKWGELHPRSLIAELGPQDETFRKELAWREFYADVLANTPASMNTSLDTRFDAVMRWTTGDEATKRLAAWQEGRTGYPFVDAGMRQLRETGWMHNRVRMVVASFLVKDLHLPWQLGATTFMRHLIDGDTASNAHGWQWTAGCGTDASPFYRVFNPIGQGLKFDPNGEYVHRFVPELRHLPGAAAHEPWEHPEGYAHGYPTCIVDHKIEREAALADYSVLKGVPVERLVSPDQRTASTP
jgi:deoxyribodipyrimidine photo-lyase